MKYLIIKYLRFYQKLRKWIFIWMAPIILSLIPLLIAGKESKCVFVVSLMVIYWLTEAVPLAVTSLIPIFLFPLFDIQSTKQVSSAYINDTLMVFLGSIIATVSVEQSNLHQRIALRILMLFGTSPVWLLLGFMCATAFISLWISDTATTALMVPIVEAVLLNLKEQTRSSISHSNNNNKISISSTVDEKELHLENIDHRKRPSIIIKRIEKQTEEEKSFHLMRKCIYLSVTYSSLIGGTGTITGTTTNMIFKGMATNLEGDNVTFANWMFFAMPALILNIILVWIYIIVVFVRKFPKSSHESDKNKAVMSFIKTKYQSLGPISFHEMSVLIIFLILLCLWFFRDPDFFTGWSPAIHPENSNYINDASAAMFMVFMCFAIPSNPRDIQNSDTLMNWKTVQEKVPWGVFLLMGGAFAMASGIKVSGLSQLMGKYLTHYLQNLSPLLLVVIVSTLSMFFTEVSSNAATSTIFLPIVKQLAESLGISPLRFMLPVTVSCSFAFMFPAGAPTNAIVYEAAKLRTYEMAIPGFFAKFICLAVVILSTNTWGYVVYNMHDLNLNTTLLLNTTIY